MKYFKYCLKVNKSFILTCLVVSFLVVASIIIADLPNVGVKGFWIPILIGLGIMLLVLLFAFFMVYRLYKRNLKVFKLMDSVGPSDEMIAAYRQAYPKLNAMNHVILASYYKAYDHLDEANQELDIAGRYVMLDAKTRAYYSEVLIDLKIMMGRFDEAIIIYNNYNSLLETYCRSHKDAICVQHYFHGALLYAYSGNFDSAMICIGNMEKTISKIRELAFTRNTALMGVYLIVGDFADADNIRNLMLKDLEEFDEFSFESYRALARKDIDNITAMFDPREQSRDFV